MGVMTSLKPPFPFSFPPLPPFAALTQSAWAVDEMQRRVVLLLNHITQQEPQAMQRLVAHKGRVVALQWRSFRFQARITPAGLFDLADSETPADLHMSITEESPLPLLQTLLQGNKPPLRIEGDVALASDFNWLVAHVRWDVEDDLARLLGDTVAHTLVQAARSVLKGHS
jgi:ubiquinone biosynthesis accessory factor UbiJ